MQSAVDRTFERIPFTDRPSTDGVLYKPEGYNIVGGALAAAGWQNVTADDVPDQKDRTFSREGSLSKIHREHLLTSFRPQPNVLPRRAWWPHGDLPRYCKRT